MAKRTDKPTYDPIQDVYTIRGKQFAGVLFDILNGDAEDQAIYQITNTNGVVSMTLLPKSTANK